MSPEPLRRLILTVIGEVAPDADLENINPDRSFHDQFEIDSVDYLNIMMTLEARLGVTIPEADYPKLSSLEGCVRYLAPKLDGRKPQAGAGSL